MLKIKKANIKTSKAKKSPEKKISKPPEQHARIKETDKPFTLNRRNTQQPERRSGETGARKTSQLPLTTASASAGQKSIAAGKSIPPLANAIILSPKSSS